MFQSGLNGVNGKARGARMDQETRRRTDAFIERMGLSIQEEGLPRIAGRMFALFLIHGGPLGIDAIAQRLKISRASVSTNGRLLRQLGFLERLVRPGDRKDYYKLADAPYARLLDGYMVRIGARMELVRAMHAGLPHGPAGAQERLAALADFYAEVMHSTAALSARFTATGGGTP